MEHSVWISSSNSSTRHSFSRSLVAAPDGSLLGLKMHQTGLFIFEL